MPRSIRLFLSILVVSGLGLVGSLPGSMSATATADLVDAGYTDVTDLEGGMVAWQAAGRAIDAEHWGALVIYTRGNELPERFAYARVGFRTWMVLLPIAAARGS